MIKVDEEEEELMDMITGYGHRISVEENYVYTIYGYPEDMDRLKEELVKEYGTKYSLDVLEAHSGSYIFDNWYKVKIVKGV